MKAQQVIAERIRRLNMVEDVDGAVDNDAAGILAALREAAEATEHGTVTIDHRDGRIGRLEYVHLPPHGALYRVVFP